MKQLIFIILLIPIICYSAEIKIESDAFEFDGKQYFTSESGVKPTVIFYTPGPLKAGSVYAIEDMIDQSLSAVVSGYDKEDKLKTDVITVKEKLKKPKNINPKDKKKDKDK
jgi:hypothetical protein